MKIAILIMLVMVTLGCSTTDDRDQIFTQGATLCNSICMGNPAIHEMTSTAGGGMPLLFVGGMTLSCKCVREGK
ncbi:MAG: hypothetical protein ACC707_18205 [Thiohalomonadales bacterium]